MTKLLFACVATVTMLGFGCDGGDTKETNDTKAPADVVAGKPEEPATCEAKDTDATESCTFEMWSCFDPSGPCTGAAEGSGQQWENGAKIVFGVEEDSLDLYYSSTGTLCFSAYVAAATSLFVEEATGQQYDIDSNEETSCLVVWCPDGSLETVDGHEMDALIFGDAGLECFE